MSPAVGPYSPFAASATGSSPRVRSAWPPTAPARRVWSRAGPWPSSGRSLQNVAEVLAVEGATLSDVVKTTVFLLDMSEFSAVNEVWVEYFTENRPTRSAVAVAALPIGARIEVEAWAYAPVRLSGRGRRRRRRPRGPVALRHAGVPGHLPEAVADRADGLDQVGVLLAELGPQAPDVHVDRAGAAVVLVAPDPAEQRLAGEDLGRMPGQEAQELVFHVGQVEDTTRHGGLVRLEVEHERPVLNDVGPHALPGPPEEVLQARHQLIGPGGQDAEVVVEVVAQQQVADLVRPDGEEQRVSWAPRAGGGAGRRRWRRTCRHRRPPALPSNP